MANIRINSLPATTTVLPDDVVPMDGLTTRKIKPVDMINSARPFASQVQAEAGVDSETTMSPLTSYQQLQAKLPSSAAGRAMLAAADAAAQRGLLSLGGAALLSVGTTGGTVAAGNDARFNPTGGSLGQALVKQSGTNFDYAWTTIPALTDGNKGGVTVSSSGTVWTVNLATLAPFTGDSGTGGIKGLVPAPAAGDGAASKYLKADGTWGTINAGLSPVNRTALKALDTTVFKVAFLDEGGRSGVFVWTTGNFSTQIAGDTLEGVYIKANAIASSAGAWVRQFGNMPIDPRWWGAMGDLSADAAPALRAAINFAAGRRVHVPVGQYLINSEITTTLHMHVTGDGSGFGPGIQDFTNSTVFRLDMANPTLFKVTDYFGSIFRDFAIWTAPGATGGAFLQFFGPLVTAEDPDRQSHQLCTIIDNVSFDGAHRGIYCLDCQWFDIIRCKFIRWVEDAIYTGSSLTPGVSPVESGLGRISGNFFFGYPDTPQNACVNTRSGYIIVSDNEMLGARYGVKVEAAVFNAGFVHIVNNTIENQTVNGVYLSSVEATIGVGGLVSLVTIAHNEFANFSPPVDYNGAIAVKARPDLAAYLNSLIIANNHTMSTSGAGASHIRVETGSKVLIEGNRLRELGAGAPYGIVCSGGAALGTDIEVYDNSFDGTFTTPYFFDTGKVTLRTQLPLTAAQVLAIPARDGSTAFASDGRANNWGVLDMTLVGGGVGTLAVHRAGIWTATSP